MRRHKPLKGAALAPRPVHPRPIRQHGLLGMPFASQHVIVDDHWTNEAVTEQFKGMSDLLTKHIIVTQTEAAATQKYLKGHTKTLKNQCRDGRVKLYNVLHGDNSAKIRNLLIGHKELQRLYQNMPVEKVVENIDERTFVMRKERDKLHYILNKLQDELRDKLIVVATLENRIKYESEFKIEEEEKSNILRKKIENSKVRLCANRTLNITYTRMIRVLRTDAIFYDPILRSLDKDVEDQEKFIKHIVYLGLGAIKKSKEIAEEYRRRDENSRKVKLKKIHAVAVARKSSVRMSIMKHPRPDEEVDLSKRYLRETKTMIFLKNEQDALESTIKQIKFVTLCSQAQEIYPRIKSQVENNKKLEKLIQTDTITLDKLEDKMNYAQVLEGILINNLSEQEIARVSRINELKELVEKESQEEQKIILTMKNRNKLFVMLRLSLWNLYELTRHVDRAPRPLQIKYPNSYLKLPLLKFEMLAMHAVPPESFEDDIYEVMRIVVRKVYKLMREYHRRMSPEQEQKYVDRYRNVYLASMEEFDDEDEREGMDPETMAAVTDSDDILEDAKPVVNVPTYKQIKAQSAKIVEENLKKEEAGL